MSTPSAAGEALVDDRPARASTLAVSAVAGVLVAVLAVATWSPLSVGLGALSAVALAVAVRLLHTDRPLAVGLGTFVGLAATCGIGLAPFVPGDLGPTLAATVTAFGAGVAVLGGVGDGDLLDAVGLLTYAVVAAWIVTLGVSLAPVAGAVAGYTATAFVPPSLIPSGAARPDLFGFAVLLSLAVAAVRSSIRGLPIVRLAPSDDRPTVRRLVDQTDRALTRGLWVSLGGVALGVVTWVVFQVVALPETVVVLVSLPTRTPLLRGPLFAVLVVAGSIAVGSRLVRFAGGSVLDRARRGAAVGGGIAFVVALTVVSPAVVFVLSAVPGWESVFGGEYFFQLVALLAMADVAMVMTVLAVLVVPVLVGLGLVREGATGRTVAAAGLVLSAMASAGAHPLVLVALVVGAVVVWDVGEFAVGIGQEVGRDADTGRIQAIHAAGSVGVGVVTVLFAGTAYGLVQVLNASGRVALLALAAAVTGSFLLVAAIRG